MFGTSWNINDDDDDDDNDDDDGHIVVHFSILRVRMCAYASIIRDCQHKETGTYKIRRQHTNRMGASVHALFSLFFVFKCASFIFMITAHESISNIARKCVPERV